MKNASSITCWVGRWRGIHASEKANACAGWERRRACTTKYNVFDTGSCGWHARRLDAVCVRLRLQEHVAYRVQESFDENDEKFTIYLSVSRSLYIYIPISLTPLHIQREREREDEFTTGTGTGAGTETRKGAEAETRTGTGTRAETRTEKNNREGRGGGWGGEFWYPPHQERYRVEDQVLPFRTRHHLYYILYTIQCNQEGAPVSSQQLQVQDPAPAQRYGTKRRSGHQGRVGGNGDGNRDGGGERNEYESGNEHYGRDGGENGSGNGDENRGGWKGKRA